ncbi:glycosyltransferase family 2 protein [Chitinibacter bivalviorum]|uniref:Glycosyltransferase family 2 protein n=1 Tax=Chitinibacter bivalviorum TaxID=2739434 RepID=A0A7H9BGE3_9NEIS|nr:glycosyltransferase family 2 protein [Chitinibacter bivalviorum]QLG87793.1 glycosyltransferase family 2 protein [Chitinibacter bivalviorum]
MKPAPVFDLSVIVVSYNNAPEITSCLCSIQAACGALRYETYVVDNASNDGCAELVAQNFPDITLIASPVNLGFAAGNNLAFAHVRGRYIALINPDARPAAESLAEAVAWMDEHAQIGLAGGQLLDEEGHNQPSARCFPSLLNDFLAISGLAAKFANNRFFGRFDRTWANPAEAAQVDWVPGAFAIIRHQALRQVGHFDERFFLYYEEVDLCRRLKRAGYQIWYQPQWQAVHIGGVSSRRVAGEHFNRHGSQLSLWRMRSTLLYYRKHHGWLIAKLDNLLEQIWHFARQCRNAWFSQRAQAKEKAQESTALRRLLQQAWGDTAGGQRSPPTPW